MVEQPDSRGIPGFFLAIFSAVTQFDVCPVGWYNSARSFWEAPVVNNVHEIVLLGYCPDPSR